MGLSTGIGIGIQFSRGGGQDWESYWSSLISSTVENAAPTDVVLTFPTAKPALGASDFTIAGFTISSASWTDAVLTLVLSTAVVYGDTLVVTFVTTGGTAAVTNNVIIISLLSTYVTGLSTPLSEAQKIRLNKFLIETKSIMDYSDVWQIRGGETAESSLKNIVQDSYHATLQGVPNSKFFPFLGFVSDGINGYINSGFKSTDGSNFLQNDACIGIFSCINTNESTIDCGALDAGNVDIRLTLRYTNKVYLSLHTINTTYKSLDNTDSRGLFLVTRNGNAQANLVLYKNKSTPNLSSTGTGVTQSPSNINLFTNSLNNNGNPLTFNKRPHALFGAAKNFTQSMRDIFYDAFVKYISDALGDELYNFLLNKSLVPAVYVSNPLIADYCNFRSIVSVLGIYHLFQESSNYGQWTIEKRTSIDGLTFGEASLALLTAGGVGQFDQKGQADPTVIYDGAGDWKMWYDAKDGSDVWGKIGFATSTDGTNWTKYGSVLEIGESGEWDDVAVHHPCVIKSGSIYYMFYSGDDDVGANVKNIGLATSLDGINWTKYDNNPVLSIGVNGQWDDEYIRPSSPFKIGIYWFMYYWGYNGNSHSIGVAMSYDLITWFKVDKVLGNPAGGEGEVNPSACQIIREGNTLKMWYTCYGGNVDGKDLGDLDYATIDIS